jgi:hypothetical protein
VVDWAGIVNSFRGRLEHVDTYLGEVDDDAQIDGFEHLRSGQRLGAVLNEDDLPVLGEYRQAGSTLRTHAHGLRQEQQKSGV